MTEEGKQGDKVKECRETTVPLFVLKELPHHSALMGNYGYLAIRRELKSKGPARVITGLPGSCYISMATSCKKHGNPINSEMKSYSSSSSSSL